jgi:AcrR family transcriptional regulator
MDEQLSPRGESARAGRPRDAAVDTAIRKAALDLLRKEGYGAFSMEAVAARSGVSKQSIYRRWPSKGALLLELYMEGLANDPFVPSGRDVRTDLRAYLSSTVNRLADPAWRTMLQSVVAEAQSDEKTRGLLIERVIEPRREIGRRILRSALASGELPRDLDVETALDAVFGAIWYRLLLRRAAIDLAFVESLLGMLLPAAASGPRGQSRQRSVDRRKS